jgi:5-bromo-4-chloroindolyl phosphate hydrolysis protein
VHLNNPYFLGVVRNSKAHLTTTRKCTQQLVNLSVKMFNQTITCHIKQHPQDVMNQTIFHVSLINIMYYFNKPFDFLNTFQKKWNCISQEIESMVLELCDKLSKSIIKHYFKKTWQWSICIRPCINKKKNIKYV